MAKGNFENCLNETLPLEGGYVDHPKDPGGATNMGITIGTLSDELGRPATKAEVKALTPSDVKPIYKKRFWDLMGCEGLAFGVDLAVFDAGVNSGPSRAKRWLMASLDPKNNHINTIKAVCAKRLGFVQALKTFATFGRGWVRRITTIEAAAIAMAAEALSRYPEAIVANEAEEAKADSKKNGTAAAGSATAGGATSGGATYPEAVQNATDGVLNSGLLLLIGAVFIAVAAMFAWRWYVNRQRFVSLEEVLARSADK